MEKFNRDEFAEELKETRKLDGGREIASDLLENVNKTDEYKEGKHVHEQENLKDKIKKIREQTEHHPENLEKKKMKETEEIISKIKSHLDKTDSSSDFINDKETVWGLAKYLKKTGNLDGYKLIANWRLRQGDWYRVKEALCGHMGISENSEEYKKYFIECAKNTMDLLRKNLIKTLHDNVYQTLMKPQEIMEALSLANIEISKEEDKLLEALQDYNDKIVISDIYNLSSHNVDKIKKIITEIYKKYMQL
jgi:hypothetical protein